MRASLAFFGHTPCTGEDEGSDCALLDFDYSGRVFSFLFIVMESVDLFWGKIFIGVLIRVEHPYIKRKAPVLSYSRVIGCTS